MKRVHAFIKTGQDKKIVDLDPDRIYSRRKEKQIRFSIQKQEEEEEEEEEEKRE